MSNEPKKGFLRSHSGGVRLLCLGGLLAVPFGLYAAARSGHQELTLAGLVLMGLILALTMKSG